MKLFEGGILDKITNDEFEKMYQKTSQQSSNIIPPSDQATSKDEEKGTKLDATTKDSKMSSSARGEDHTTLNLRMLQGSFYLVLFGHSLAFLVLMGEIECHSAPLRIVQRTRQACKYVSELIMAKLVQRIAQWIGMLKRFR